MGILTRQIIVQRGPLSLCSSKRDPARVRRVMLVFRMIRAQQGSGHSICCQFR